MRFLLLSGAAIMLATGVARADMWDTIPVDYVCRDGVARSVLYRADGNYAWMSSDGSPPVELPRTAQEQWNTAHFAVRLAPYGIDYRVFRGPWIRCDGPGTASTIVSARG